MKLVRVEIKNYRSIFEGDGGDTLALDVAEGMNAFIGPNNCGKSNLMRAVALGIDPEFPFSVDQDYPATMNWAKPRITLHFRSEGRQSVEKTLLRYAHEYERSAKDRGATYADDGEIRLSVVYSTRGERTETLIVKGAGARGGDPDVLERFRRQFRKALRFVYVESGQSLESLLSGRFREILHTVIREHLQEEFGAAEERRRDYIEGLQSDLLDPLRSRVFDLVSDMFPEMKEASLVPRVPDIDSTLSSVDIHLRDAALTSLASKGTGVRGAVLVAMLRYLALRSRRSIVFAVEEPEAFLHPAGQADLSLALEELAEREEVTLLVTTHSPFVISRGSKAQVVSLDKDSEGRTRVLGCAAGDEPRASLLGGLFRDAALPDLIERAAEIPDIARAVLVVEGTTDALYLQVAAISAGEPELVADLHIVAAGGVDKAVAQALLARSPARPILALFDSDENGRRGRDTLQKRFGFRKKKEVMTYAELFDQSPADIEAEDLFPNTFIEAFIGAEGEVAVLATKSRRQDKQWHYDLTGYGKEAFQAYVEHRANKEDLARFVELLREIRSRMGLDPGSGSRSSN